MVAGGPVWFRAEVDLGFAWHQFPLRFFGCLGWLTFLALLISARRLFRFPNF
jgi:hypothetical protein